MCEVPKLDQKDIPRWGRREIGRYESGIDGPTLVVIGGVHGNEPAGLFAGQRVLQRLNRECPHDFSGRVIVLAGNLEALNASDPETRYIDHDLNRLCTRDRAEEPIETSAEHAQMFELFSMLNEIKQGSESMMVIDLHTTSAPSAPVIVYEDSLPARRFAMRFPIAHYLGFEEELAGLVSDRITDELGSIACVIEGGQHADPRSIEVLEHAIWIALDASGILPIGSVALGIHPARVLSQACGESGHQVFDIRHREPIQDPGFMMMPRMRSGTSVITGKTVVAHQSGEPVVAPVMGRVFLPNLQQHKRVGDDAFFIVRHVGPMWLDLSARIRKTDWVHSVIAHCPGVYRMTDDAGREVLYVDGDLACVLKRQIFHLLGYRLVRHDNRDGGSGIRRIREGVSAFCRAFARGPIRGGPDRGDPRFWIVRRRRLDLDS